MSYTAQAIIVSSVILNAIAAIGGIAGFRLRDDGWKPSTRCHLSMAGLLGGALLATGALATGSGWTLALAGGEMASWSLNLAIVLLDGRP